MLKFLLLFYYAQNVSSLSKNLTLLTEYQFTKKKTNNVKVIALNFIEDGRYFLISESCYWLVNLFTALILLHFYVLYFIFNFNRIIFNKKPS